MYAPTDFSGLLGTPGFSDALLSNHFTLYEGYVKNTNTIIELLNTKAVGTPEYSELQRRFGWEWNGMRLHELYFGNMIRGGAALSDGVLKDKITEAYGDFESWKRHFLGLGAMRGIGWVILTYDRESNKLFNIWVNEHDLGHLAGTMPLLVMDVFEHAFMLDYGLKRANYVTAFCDTINWKTVESRM